jgi:hypothetical protein
MDIITLANFDPDMVNIAEPKASAAPSKVKFLDISYGPEKRKLSIQLPSMRVPFETMKNDNGPTIVVSFDDESLAHKLRRLDERLLEFATSRSEVFFGSFKVAEIVKEKLNPFVKDKSGFKPILQSKMIIGNDGSNRTPVFESNGKRTSIDGLKKNSWCTVVMGVPCVYIGGTGFGFSKKAERVRIDQVAFDSDSFCFIDEESTVSPPPFL